MMKVLLINSVWGGHPGGIESYITQVIQLLHRNGHQVTLAYGRRKGEYIGASLPVTGTYELAGLDQLPGKGNADLPGRLLDLAARVNPDVVFVQDIVHYDALAALQQARPVVVMFHDYRPICLKETRRDFFFPRLCDAPLGYRCLLRGHFLRRPAAGSLWPRLQSLKQARKRLAALQQCHQALAASEYARTAYLCNGFAAERVSTLPLFTAERTFDPISTYPREKVILFVGRLTDRYKGADLLLEVMQRCREEVRLVIAGEGRYAARIRSLAARKEILHRVRFMGWVQGEALQQLYRQAMAVVMPSLWAEPFGLVGLEAMANGTPIIAFEVGGIPQWLRENVTGFMVPWLDTTVMAERIDRLAANPVLVRQMGLAGRERIHSDFSETFYLEGLMACFTRAIARFRSGAAPEGL